MALPKNALRNLLDLMQKSTLAILPVSIGLLSNALFSHRSVEKDALSELAQLLKTREKMESML
jgi:hypothetical protein